MPESDSQSLRPIWIASYPRSGNTFLRIILQNIFHLPSYSIYRVAGQDFKDPSADALEESPPLPAHWRELLSDNPAARLAPIKTHGPPENDAPAIYIVRDGRAAIHSYYHYHQKFAFERPSLTEIIAGACQFGSWSEHVLAWRPQSRPRTLLLRYDDLVTRPMELVPQLAQFLGVAPAAGQLPTFAELQRRAPAFFRRGRNEDFLSEWTPAHRALCNRLHGPTLRELGFSLTPEAGSDESLLPELARSAARSHALYVEQLTRSGGIAAAHRELLERIRALERQRSGIEAELSRWSDLLVQPWVRVGLALGMVKKPAEKNGSKR